MAITAADVNKLRQMTGSGMMDCKNALVEAEGDFDKAIDILRKKGQKIAAKRADRNANEGYVVAKTNGDNTFGIVLMVNCETDFVGKTADFTGYANALIDLAIAKHITSKEELMKADFNGQTVEASLTEMSGKTGEKVELNGFASLEKPYVNAYNHMGNRLAVIVGFNKGGEALTETAHEIAMQIAAMNPIAVDEKGVAQEVIDRELEVGKEKTIQEQIQKAVDAALTKAGINPAHVDSDDHINSNITKGWITEEQAQQAREIKVKVAEEKAKNIPAEMVEKIAKGRLNKFFKENTLLHQEFIRDTKMTVAEFMQKADKELACEGFCRIQLGA
ncbi:MAG: elongation factor Ts [Bacteroidales bacterium]|nr:elongation factor Ts [Bacteroidales bacterium]